MSPRQERGEVPLRARLPEEPLEVEGSPVDPPSALVLEAIGEATGLDPTRRPIPLAEYVDPDALDALFGAADARFAFEMWGDGGGRQQRRQGGHHLAGVTGGI